MGDTKTPQMRSQNMAKIKNKNTTPEIAVRKLLYSMGYRYRLHAKDLPGKPDIIFKGKKKAIFVNGCFWHGHSGCNKSRRPTSNINFWNNKIDNNIKRDALIQLKLHETGWTTLTIWECQTKHTESLKLLLEKYMSA